MILQSNKSEVTIDVPDMSGGAGGGFILNSTQPDGSPRNCDADSGKILHR